MPCWADYLAGRVGYGGFIRVGGGLVSVGVIPADKSLWQTLARRTQHIGPGGRGAASLRADT